MAATTIAQEITRLTTAKADLKTAIEGKGVTVPSSTLLDGYAALVDQIQQGGAEEAPENDVNFYDFDGRRIASYTIAEAKALTELPTPPTHEGLRFQAWNWTLNDIATYDRQYIDVGANYITTDGKTHIFARVTENNVTLSIMGRNGTISVNWGDGSAEDGYTYTTQLNHSFTHTYADVGVYEIVIGFTTSQNGDYFLSNRYIASSAGWIGIAAYEIRYGSHILWNAQNQHTSGTPYVMSIPSDVVFEGNQTIQRSYIDTVVFPRNNAISFTLAYPVVINHLIFPRSVTFFGQNGYLMYRSAINRLVVPEYTDTTAKNGNLFNSIFVNVLSLPSSVSFAAAATLDSAGLAYIDIVQGWTPNKNMTINQSHLWTAADLVKFFTKLGTTSTAITLTFGVNNLNKLTDEQKAIATDKGYTLA